MDGGKSDASTSTDDVKDRPLCLFYFTHPFGVLSPEPPTITTAPPSVTRAFLNMEPISPFYWPGSTAQTTPAEESSYRSTGPSTARYDIGDTTVHHEPLSVLSVARTRHACAVELPRRDSSTMSSSLFASDVWFPSSGSSRLGYARRAPYTRILPPLQLPSPKDVTDCSSDDIWPRKCISKFSLPPIEMPPVTVTLVRDTRRGRGEELSSVDSVSSVKESKCRRKLGVNKASRRERARGRLADVRRRLTCLMRRATAGRGTSLQECTRSPALQHVLSTIREAWTEPTSLKDRCRVLSRIYARSSALERGNTTERDSEQESEECATMLTRTQLTELPPQPGASPGLLRRRYSVPETIMRKYRLAQLNSESEDGAPDSGSAVEGDACPSLSPPRDTPRSAGESPRHARRDRELMRRSALLRRMWARGPAGASPPAPRCCCDTHALQGARDHKRQRLEPRPAPSTADLSDWTPYVETTDALSVGTASSPRASSRPRAPDHSTIPTNHAHSYEDSTFSASVSTAKETPGSAELVRSDFVSSNERLFEDGLSVCERSVESADRNVLTSERLVCDSRAPYEVLEVVVSESARSSPPAASERPGLVTRVRTPPPHRATRNIDEYVSHVLMESLNSLTDRLECMNASMGPDRKLSVVEKEIKVRLQNAAVNTIVHLSPTSNNQIIFGNEELCDEAFGNEEVCNEQHCNGETCVGTRDECNNPRALMLRHPRKEDNNNGSPSASPPTPSTDALMGVVIQHNNVNRAVLQQIQELFHAELRHEDSERSLRHGVGAVSHIEISNVDTFLSGGDSISVSTQHAAGGAPISGVRAGNYFRDLDTAGAALVPRCSALPHTTSMEVNTSSEEDTELGPLGSDAASLVDSLDDPDSPRSAHLRRRSAAAGLRRPELVRSAVDVLTLLPEDVPRDSAPRDGGEAFFVRIRDDVTPDGERARVAEYMPERIRQKLHRRHCKRELRMECARRSKVRQLKEELERRRREEQARARRRLERDCAALVSLLLDELIATIAQDEYTSMRTKRKSDIKTGVTRSQENLNRGNGRRDPETHPNGKHDGARRRRSDESDERNRRPEKHQIRGKLVARPTIATAERGPHRIYQKSEIREGDKCIEILEILEYSQASRSSADSTPTDEHAGGARGRRSRIPVPVSERAPHMRLTGGAEPTPFADLLLRALAPAPCPAPAEPRSRSNSLRFKRVFDMIPEERASGSLSFDSSADAEETEGTRRASTPAPAPAPAPVVTRSAGTSPPAELRRLRSRTTMTSPSNRSAATSPWHAPPTSPPRRPPPREGIVCALRPPLHRTTASLAVE